MSGRRVLVLYTKTLPYIEAVYHFASCAHTTPKIKIAKHQMPLFNIALYRDMKIKLSIRNHKLN